MTFRVITPVTVDDDVFVSSTIPEPDTGETAWSDATTYSTADVIYYTNHKRYESLIDSSLDNLPDAEIQNDPDTPPTKWLELGYTNRWKMFDLLRNVKSEGDSPMEIVLEPGQRINAIGLFGVEADNLTITLEVGEEEVYSYTENLNTRNVEDWVDYFFEPFTQRPSAAVFDVPPYSTAQVIITLESSTGTVRIGSLVVGNSTNIGDVMYGAESDVMNFSRIDRAFDGTSLLLPRRSVPKTVQRIIIEKNRVNVARSLRKSLNATPAVWAGIDQTDDEYFESLLILGIYKRFSINLDHPTAAIIDLEIEEI
jgi:hypothetical protein